MPWITLSFKGASSTSREKRVQDTADKYRSNWSQNTYKCGRLNGNALCLEYFLL
jgi:hypothetical protein